jgi:hypothetical protein
LPLDMTHAARHSVVEGEPPIEKQLLPSATIPPSAGAVGKAGSPIGTPTSSGGWPAANLSGRLGITTKTIAVSQAGTYTVLIGKIDFVFIELQRFDVIYQHIRIEKSRGIDFSNPTLGINKKDF